MPQQQGLRMWEQMLESAPSVQERGSVLMRESVLWARQMLGSGQRTLAPSVPGSGMWEQGLPGLRRQAPLALVSGMRRSGQEGLQGLRAVLDRVSSRMLPRAFRLRSQSLGRPRLQLGQVWVMLCRLQGPWGRLGLLLGCQGKQAVPPLSRHPRVAFYQPRGMRISHLCLLTSSLHSAYHRMSDRSLRG
jgi:hypothetical protein